MLCSNVMLWYVITLLYVVLSGWVTWPEHPKDAKDEVERPKLLYHSAKLRSEKFNKELYENRVFCVSW